MFNIVVYFKILFKIILYFQVHLVDEVVAGAEVTLVEGVDQLVVEGAVEVANKITDRNTDFLLVLYLKNLYIAT